jgi:hypothetical protein
MIWSQSIFNQDVFPFGCTMDFIVDENKEVLFLDGGATPPRKSACCFGYKEIKDFAYGVNDVRN